MKYERQYSDALAELRSRKFKVASPHSTPDGVRRVQINSVSCLDHAVFEKAWSRQIADKIMNETSPR